jgi:phosphatidylserine/phosphatidylglycerophosphate/cardiolipin synthase-like enzyme
LLDSFFDDAEANRSNRATVEHVATIAEAEGLDLAGATGNPTGDSTHAKLYLVRVGGETWSAVGSLNGGEVSHKLNREVVLLVDSPAAYDRLTEVFAWDWAQAVRWHLTLSRTIAIWRGETIQQGHLAEALQCRPRGIDSIRCVH